MGLGLDSNGRPRHHSVTPATLVQIRPEVVTRSLHVSFPHSIHITISYSNVHAIKTSKHFFKNMKELGNTLFLPSSPSS